MTPQKEALEPRISYEEYRRVFDALAPRQKEWVRAKAQWEHMTLWAVVIEYPIPPIKDLGIT